MTTNQYLSYLSRKGSNLAQARRHQSDMVLNSTWYSDPTYKRAYILTQEGWKWEDIKYQYHQSQSVAKDNVDYYLQFRPKVHYPIGTYIIIPDDTSPELNLTKEELINPFRQPIQRRTQWWLIVDRDNQNAYPRYNVLQCNWEFKWIYNGKIESVFSVVRSANSYTSGIWRAEKTITLDNLTGFWAPDTNLVYGANREKLGLSDTRTIMHDQRFLLTTNDLDPKVYTVTKVVETSPLGLYKYSIKEDEYNPKRDNIELKICDYYTNMGDLKSDVLDLNLTNREFQIVEMVRSEEDELIPSSIISSVLALGKTLYYQAKLGLDYVQAVWDIQLKDDENQYDQKEKARLEGLIKLVQYDGNVVSVRASKANSLIGKHFELYARQDNGNYISKIELEVGDYDS